MITAAEARKKAHDENAKLSPIVMTLIDKKIKAACKEGRMAVEVRFSMLPLEDRHVNHVLSLLADNGFGACAHRLTNACGDLGDWLFKISW